PREQYAVEEILQETFLDLDQIAAFLNELRRFEPKHDDKLKALVKLLRTDAVLKRHKVLIFTEFADTARYLERQLLDAGLDGSTGRLMRRTGRVDRRLDPAVEKRRVADAPDAASVRGRVAYWNFLPPDELNALLTLYARVTHKTLRISKTFGIEGKKLLTPED